MKRFLFLIGLLTVIILPISLAQAQEEEGAGEPIDCEALLGAPEPVSPYVKAVLKRVKDARDYAQSDDSGGGTFGSAILWAGSAVLSTIDTQLRIVEQSKNLSQRTTCEEYDMLLLECTLEDIRSKINDALGGSKYVAAYRLQELYRFLNERIRNVLTGSRDPNFKDVAWEYREIFDPPKDVWCCIEEQDVCQKVSDERCKKEGLEYASAQQCAATGCKPAEDPGEEATDVCPFSSDYFPPGKDGFGCDAKVLEALKGYRRAETETKVLKELTDGVSAFRKQSKELVKLEDDINGLLGIGSSSPPPDEEEEEPKHRSIEGCPVEDCPPNGEPGNCNKGWKGCSGDGEDAGNYCQSDSDCSGGGGCDVQKPPEDFVAWEVRGPFSAVRDERKLVSTFVTRRTQEPRKFSKQLRFPGEDEERQQPEEQQQQEEQPVEELGAIRDQKLRFRARFSLLSEAQGENEAILFAQGSDPVYQVADALEDLRKAGAPLMRIASEQSGLRQGVLRFAWFLRRSCTDRPCGQKLDQIMRIAQADDCFPYVSGNYQSQTCEEPQWKKCYDEAKLSGEAPEPPKLECE